MILVVEWQFYFEYPDRVKQWKFLFGTVMKWKFSQHALFRYVYNRSLFDIFTQVEMAEE